MNVGIREAQDFEHGILTEISFASKRYWNYPEEYFAVWKSELTISSEYIRENMVFVAEAAHMPIGYFSIVNLKEDFWAGKVFMKKGFWLEHMFIKPDFIGKGVGAKLILFAQDFCRKKKIDCLLIFSDPQAKGFYNKMGARYIEEYPSSIEGRTVSLYELAI